MPVSMMLMAVDEHGEPVPVPLTALVDSLTIIGADGEERLMTVADLGRTSVALGNVAIPLGGSVVALATVGIPAGATFFDFVPDQDLRYSDDGVTSPSASVGIPVVAGQAWRIDSALADVRFFAPAGVIHGGFYA